MKQLTMTWTLLLLTVGVLAGCQPIQPDAATGTTTTAPVTETTTTTEAMTITWPVVEPVLETQDVLNVDEGAPADTRLGDADDPAIWVHPTDSAQSLIIGALKNGGLDVYDLDGQVLQSISPEGARFNNVDVQYDFPLGDNMVDLAVTTDRYGDKLIFFAIDPATRQLTDVTDPANPLVYTPAGQESDQETTAYGIALYKSATSGKLYAFVTQRDALQIVQVEIVDNGNGLIGFTPVRMITLPAPGGEAEPQSEGMVADWALFTLPRKMSAFGNSPPNPTPPPREH
jgi:myo-inositol-hexaphosphate 3-phosphohydrolase